MKALQVVGEERTTGREAHSHSPSPGPSAPAPRNSPPGPHTASHPPHTHTRTHPHTPPLTPPLTHQLGALLLGPTALVGMVLDRFGLGSWLTDVGFAPPMPEPGDLPLEMYAPIAEECVLLLLLLVTELPQEPHQRTLAGQGGQGGGGGGSGGGGSGDGQSAHQQTLRRALIHKLAASTTAAGCTHSELAAAAGAGLAEVPQTMFDDTLATVARTRNAQARNPGQPTQYVEWERGSGGVGKRGSGEGGGGFAIAKCGRPWCQFTLVPSPLPKAPPPPSSFPSLSPALSSYNPRPTYLSLLPPPPLPSHHPHPLPPPSSSSTLAPRPHTHSTSTSSSSSSSTPIPQSTPRFTAASSTLLEVRVIAAVCTGV